MDKPSSPAGEAKIAFYDKLFGRSLKQRLSFRKRALATTLDDLKAVTERYFKPDAASFGLITSREGADSLQLKDVRVVNL